MASGSGWAARNVYERARRARRTTFVLLASALALSAPRARANEPVPAPEPHAASKPATPSPAPSASGAVQPANSEAPAPVPEYSDTDASALTEFSATLRPYGHWIQDPTYGTVWIPYPRIVGADFGPYVSAGHWALTADNEWIWVSDYPFGWVVFHYGRWVWVSGRGWAWVPGRRYAPAWVVWRVPDEGYDEIGWAPMPPAFVWFGGAVVWLRFGPPVPYVFCPTRYVFARSVRRHLVARARLAHAAAHTRHYHHPPGRSARDGPSLSAAHVPARAVPRTRARPDPRALSVARRPARFGAGPSRVRPGFGARSVRPRPAPARVQLRVRPPARAAPRRVRPRHAPVRRPRTAPHHR